MRDGAQTGPTWALVPVKALGRAKTRLSAVLSPAQRARLQSAMLSDVLTALAKAARVDGVAVTSSDPAVAELAGRFGARVLPDAGGGDPNAALAAAVRILRAEASFLVVVPADLPLLASAEIDRAIAQAVQGQATVVVPDRHGAGTNALVFPAAAPPSFGFGEGSFRRHLVGNGGPPPVPLVLPSVGLDIDTPDDLALLARGGVPDRGGRTRATLSTFEYDRKALQENCP